MERDKKNRKKNRKNLKEKRESSERKKAFFVSSPPFQGPFFIPPSRKEKVSFLLLLLLSLSCVACNEISDRERESKETQSFSLIFWYSIQFF